MKKLIILTIISLLLLGCSNKEIYYEKKTISNDEVPDLNKIIEGKIDSMTLEEKIGQMLVIKYSSKTVDDDLKKVFNDIKPGGFIIFGSNISTFENTKTFIKDIKKLSKEPLIVSLDQEGGLVQKIQLIEDKDVLYIPSMADVGKINDEGLAYDIGTVIAKELMTLGVNVTYAPVMDIYSNPNDTTIATRSFGSDKQLVSKMGISVAKGLENTGVIPTYKHFPGHGDTATNSHNSLPIINKTYDEIINNELVPFIDAIENGAKIIMVGHLSFPKITNDNTPASLSKKIINDILIEDLGYNGLIITDALDMGAVINNYSEEKITTMAINAGVDLLLMPRNIYETVEYIKNNISEERINESVRKILKFKYQYLKDYELLDESYLNNDLEKEIINKVK